MVLAKKSNNENSLLKDLVFEEKKYFLILVVTRLIHMKNPGRNLAKTRTTVPQRPSPPSTRLPVLHIPTLPPTPFLPLPLLKVTVTQDFSHPHFCNHKYYRCNMQRGVNKTILEDTKGI
jgi:hypothetical protein